jgi:type II secretory pathway component GspD/PulD (secretin)
MIETSLTDTEKLGIDWTTTMKVTGAKRPVTWPFSGGTMPGFTTNDPASTDFAGPNSMPYSVKSDFTLGTLDFSSLQAVFDMLKSRQKTKLVANPRIITLNNQSATINVGKVLSLPTYERNETTGKMDITGWQTYNVGVNLDVTPQISPDGHIKLKLKPNVNSLIGYASVRDGVNEGPITSSRSAQTEVQIKDGESVVIGGLVKEESLTITKKVPFLGDIPFIGALFTRKEVGSDANPTEKTDLLIFVTAHILKEGEPLPSGAQVAQAKDDAQAQGRPFNLQLRDKR